ncbi:MAG: DUF692 domain-containing protein [Bdellovibrionales bacterium]|nr:DUF692 domain-containing protein [Bdellovibrionales bacterium]
MNVPRCMPGMGLRTTHYSYLESRPKTSLKWFEVVSENYMDTRGRPFQILNLIREDYQIALHGVSMSLASAEGLSGEYLKNLKTLIEHIDPFIVSDHLCWSGRKSHNLHDLLPFPYTQESLQIVVENVLKAQDFLKRPLVIENVSTYMTFETSEMTEWEFLNQVLERTGASLLMDVNNVYVSSVNHGFSGHEFIDTIPHDKISQIHLAGYTEREDFLFDTHSRPVHDPVWPLFEQTIRKNPETPFMVEWDEEIPEFSVVEEEVKKAIRIWQRNFSKVPNEVVL